MPINVDGTIKDDYVAPSQKVNKNETTGTNIEEARVPNDYLGKDAFLQLMITQLRYQDPLDPMDNKDSIAQMAQFSALEQMQNLNNNMQISQAGIKLAVDDLTKNLIEIKKALAAYGIKVEKPEDGEDSDKTDEVDDVTDLEGEAE